VRILVYEFASGGGLAGRNVPASLAREGGAMRAALVQDLLAIGGHQLVTTADARVRPRLPPDVEVAVLPAGDRARGRTLDRLIAAADGVWLIAPETGRCLERLAARVERQAKTLFGPGAEAIARASDKARLPRRLAAAGVSHPATRAIGRDADPAPAAVAIGYPLVVKPARGAGSLGVGLAEQARDLRRAVALARQAAAGGAIVLQRYVEGTAASVSLLADGRRAVPLAVNRQAIGAPPSFAYRGGATPFDHPLAPRAIAVALAACRALPGLCGFVGVDVILTGTDAVVIEVNPRLTTAYLGVRAAFAENVAALALAACAGRLPPAPHAQRRVRFSASGRVVVGNGPTEAPIEGTPSNYERLPLGGGAAATFSRARSLPPFRR
jgi:predicted ATP-grasp superfamily ATP-dependent carboligase